MIYDGGPGERSVGPGAGEGKRGSHPHSSARGTNKNLLENDPNPDIDLIFLLWMTKFL